MKNLITISFILTGLMVQAQLDIGIRKGRWDDSIDGLLTSTSTVVVNSENLDQFEGHPFLDEDFERGKAIFGDKKLDNLKVRYNVALEDMEVKMDGEIMVINNKDAIVYIQEKKYAFYEYRRNGKNLAGYFQVLVEPRDGGATLLMKHYKVLRDGGPMRIGDEAPRKDKLDNESAYYLLLDDKPEKIEKHEDEFLLLFPEDRRKKVEDYMDKNRLKASKDEDLVQIVNYYNQLK